MPFQVINSSEIDVGDALKKELFDKVKNSLDDLNTRLGSVESGGSKIEVFRYTIMNAASSSTMTGLDYFIANSAFNLTNATVQIFEKGTLTGTLEIDVKKSTTNLNGPSFTTVFSTKPSVNLTTAADYAVSTNQVFNTATTAIAVGNILRLDITQLPTGTIGKFIVSVFGEK